MQVREIIQLKGGTLYTATPQQALVIAIDTMAELDVGSLVVMESGKMAGMLTFREVMLALKTHGFSLDGVKVGDVMVRDPVTAFMDGTTLMGVISFLDVAKAVLEEQNFENKMLKNYIKNWPDEPQA